MAPVLSPQWERQILRPSVPVPSHELMLNWGLGDRKKSQGEKTDGGGLLTAAFPWTTYPV